MSKYVDGVRSFISHYEGSKKYIENRQKQGNPFRNVCVNMYMCVYIATHILVFVNIHIYPFVFKYLLSILKEDYLEAKTFQ